MVTVNDIVNDNSPGLKQMFSALERIQAEIVNYHPKALLLFGSLARYLDGKPGNHPPNDVDLLVITNNMPFSVIHADYGCTVELHRFTTDHAIGIAKILRYDSRLSALSKLYGSVLAREHSIDIITAAMMLGSDYGRFGIEQIEVDGLTDTRDYSIHRALAGESWWKRLCRYARERRGPIKRFSDKISCNYEFKG